MKSTFTRILAAVAVVICLGVTTLVQAQCNIITTIAGTGTAGFSGDGAPATAAALNGPNWITADAAGNYYISDGNNHRIRKISTSGIITTIAGSGTAGFSGDGGPATAARLNQPCSIVFDTAGNLYIGDLNNNRIRKVNTSGIISTFAGTGTASYTGDGGAATAATLHLPYGLVFDAAGNLFVADEYNHAVRKINTSGIISTVAGTGTLGFSGDGGAATAARLYYPNGITSDRLGNIYVMDNSNHRIRKIATTGIITTVAGNGSAGFAGDGGAATSATINFGCGIVTDYSGNLYFADGSNNRIRVVNASGIISTYAGTGTASFSGDGGAATAAAINNALGVAFDNVNNILIADCNNNRVRKVLTGAPAVGAISGPSTVAVSSTITLTDTTAGGTWSSNSASIASVNTSGIVTGVAAGSTLISYSVSSGCATTVVTRVVNVTTSSSGCNIITTIAGTGTASSTGNGGPATSATIYNPSGLVISADGTIYISEADGHYIRKVSPSGTISVFAGTGFAGYGGDGGPATAAQLNRPIKMVADLYGNIYVAELNSNRVRKITPAGTITTVAGNGTAGFSGDGGQATAARLNQPSSIAFDATGNMYIADYVNKRIRKVTPAGIISTYAGTGATGSSGDGGPATAATFNGAFGICSDASGVLYVADASNNKIRKITTSGIISTFAGLGTAGYSGDGGQATVAGLFNPAGVTLDNLGNVIVADQFNQRTRKILPSGIISTIAGNGTGAFGGDGGPATAASTYNSNEVQYDTYGNLYICDDANQRVRKVTSGSIAVAPIIGATAVISSSTTTLTDATYGGTWATSNASIASVNSSGVVTGVSVGTAVISYLVTNACGTATAILPMTVGSYCTPTFASSCGTYNMNTSIKRLVGITGVIADTSACTAGSYEDMTALSCSLVQGTTYNTTLYVTGGYYATFSDQIWIDFNNDGTFSSSETVGGDDTFATSSPVIPLVIPAGAALGTHRMRIVGNYTSGGCCGSTVYPNMNPCPTSSTTFGDARDYTVTIVPATPVLVATPDSVIWGCTSVGSVSTIQYFNLTGSYLTPASGTVTITAPANFQVFVSGGWATSATLSYSGSAVAAGIAVRYTPTSTGYYGGSISITGGGAPSEYVYVEGYGCAACTGTPTAGTAIATVALGCTAYSTTLSLSGATLASGITYQWQSAPTSGGTWTNVSGATNATYTLTVVAPVYYRCVLTCSTSSSSSSVVYLGYGTPTVNAIVGPTTLCIGSNVLLTNSTPGGSWSTSGSSVATINSSTGVLYGLGAGVLLVTYTVTNSCGASNVIRLDTVVSSGLVVAAISGPSSVCIGSPTTFTDATSGGVWSNAFPAIASVSSTGTVYGITTGTDTLKYYVQGYCTPLAVKVISVITAPNAGTISGPATVCVSGTATYTTTGSGGSWSIAHPSIATINSATGIVTGLTTGADTVYYTVTNSCGTVRATYVINVIASPSAGTISGPSSVCIGSLITLTDGVSGGVWSSSNNAIASVTTAGVVRGNSAGSATITYTVTNSCGSVFTTKAIASGTSGSSAGTITGPNTVCVGSAITLTDTVSGGTWTSGNPAVASLTGPNVGGISAGTAIISYTVTGSCGTGVATYTITVNPLPTAGTISGADTICAGVLSSFTDGVSGGTWSSSNTSIASINPASGVAMGIIQGNAILTYTVTNSCGTATATRPVYVRDVPGAGTITGTTTACVGSTTTLTNAVTGGTWTSSNGSIASVNSAGVVRGNAAGTATITYTVSNGCGTATATTTVTITGAPTAGTISGPTSVCVGSTIALTDAVSGGTWSSSNATLATVNPSTGLVSGTGAGAVIISYTVTTSCGTAVATSNITVNAGSSVNPIVGATTVCPAATITLTDATTGGTWSSSSTARATVSTTGVVTGVTAGAVTISYTVTGTCGSTSATKAIAVNAAPSAGTITGTTTICAGSTTTLTDAVSGGTWSSSNPAIASVTSAGVVRGNAAGTAIISYSITNSCGTATATATVTVTTTATAGSITGASSVCVGSSITLSDAVSGGVWSSSASSVASVSSTGVVTGITTGTTTISYTVTNTCGTATATTVITVNPALTAGAITGSTTVCTGAATTLADAVSGGVWSSSNASIATVNATGNVTGVATGTATISYTVTNSCGSATATAVVTVIAMPTAGTISGATVVCPGSTSTLTDAVTGGVWSSSNTTIVTVSTTGVITGVAVGAATISYTVTNSCGAATATANITVSGSPSAGTITGTMTACVGGTTTLADATSGGVWSSSNSAIATVSTAGVVTGVAAGTVTISYRVTNSCGSATATATVTITSGTSVAAITGATTVCTGATTTLADATAGGTWSSSNPVVASVNSTGVVTGVAAGTAIITYSVTSSCGTGRATVTITVTGTPTVAAITGTTSVCTGASVTLADATAGGTWSSSNAAVASVNAATGAVSGVSAGSATISYSVTNSCGTRSVTTTVTVISGSSAGTIVGSATACTGTTTNYSNTATGGTWSSSNATVASVSASGVVTAVAAGTATISYTLTTSCGTAVATKVITVSNGPAVAAITGTTTACVGTSTTLADATTGGTWSSSTPSVATVNASTGVVTGLSVGTTTISYTITASCGPIVRTATVTVNNSLSAGTITGAATVCAGTNIALSDTTAGGTWSSSNTSIAVVSAAGVVTGVAAGTVTISYTVSNSCGTMTATKAITVNAAATAGTITGTSTLCTGALGSLTDAVTGGVWSSSNAAVVSVNATGLITGVSAGTATISYTVTNSCGTVSATTTITVSTGVSAGTISGATTVCTGATTTFTSSSIGGTWSTSNTSIATINASTGVATGVGSGSVTISYVVTGSCGSPVATKMLTVNASAVAGTISGTSVICTGNTSALSTTGTGGTWTSNNPAIASVTVAGLVRGNAVGSAVISYSATNGCGTVVATKPVTVVSSASAGTLSGASAVCAGSAIALTSTAPGGTWTSSNTAIATVDATGTVTGIAAGSVTITYTVVSTCGTVSATKAFTVSNAATAGTVSGAAAICAGTGSAFTSTAPGGVWSSSNTLVATVSAAGLVTGISNGTATISYTVTNSCGSATATATVAVSTGVTAGVISGATTICPASPSTLTSTVTGGTWTSSNVAIASVNSATGTVYGVSGGSATISYAVTNACGITSTSTIVNVAVAGNISGAAAVCVGASTLFTNPASGGTWSSNNNTVATISSTGLVGGVAAGTTTISYIMVSSCGTTIKTTTITVNPAPNAGIISGAATLVRGTSTTLTASVGGGIWSSSSPALATISATGVVTGVAAGIDTIKYSVTNSCGTAVARKVLTITLTRDGAEPAPFAEGTTPMEVNIYPNPASALVHIAADVKVNVMVMTATGRVVLDQKEATDIDLSRFVDGMYMIMVYDAANNSLLKTAKLMKIE